MLFTYVVAYFLVCIASIAFDIVMLTKLNSDVGSELEIRIFRRIVYCHMIFLATNAIWIWNNYGYITDTYLNVGLSIVNLLSLSHAAYFWLGYSFLKLNVRKIGSKWFSAISRIPITIIMLLIVSTPWTHLIFTVSAETGYVHGPLYFLQIIVEVGYLVYPSVYAMIASLKTRSAARKKEYYNLISFQIAPLVGGIIDTIFPNLPIMELSLLFAIFMIFSNLQESQIYNDALTGLNNRRLADEFLMSRILVCSEEKPLYFFIADANGFKGINDQYGHLEGDKALCLIASCLREVGASYRGLVARWGGDEFVIISAHPLSSPKKLIQLIKNSLEEKAKASRLSYELSLSIGYAVCTDPSTEPQGLIRAADERLYAAKAERLKHTSETAARGLYGANESLTREDIEASHQLLAERLLPLLKDEEQDTLTGLPNMTFFRNYAGKLRDALQDNGLQPVVVYFNIERLKSFNSEFGYQGGDDLLQGLSNVLQVVFSGELVSRFADDHFVVLTDRASVEQHLEEVHMQMYHYSNASPVQVKAGIYVCKPREKDISIACDCAKRACDSLRGNYSIYFRYFDSELRDTERRMQYILSHFDEALEKHWIRVYYQPIVLVETGVICKSEALCRWVDPEQGLLYPADFISVLEKYRLIHKLDLYMIRQVCEDYKEIAQKSDHLLPTSVNLSRLDFELCDIVGETKKILQSYGLPSSLINIEITESTFSENEDMIRRASDAFRADGFEIWMDDFGCGSSSLSVLASYDFDVIKFDMFFLREFSTNHRTRTIISSMSTMLRALGVRMLIEGIETKEQLRFLQGLSCEYGQGYLFYKPMPLGQYEDLLLDGASVSV